MRSSCGGPGVPAHYAEEAALGRPARAEEARRAGRAPSAAVLDRLGFRREGLLRRYRAGDDGREDRVVYAVVPGELVVPERAIDAPENLFCELAQVCAPACVEALRD